ncbi:unnamed protein product [Dibothriocephalus latus]|uniref:Uncharacterized protein n=1 Tax=Dibothriocephalus latus TaxID=60516 RepID=A0A3P6QIH3_DIBLA|nr:unnamed protein product [Dibothriocephalus latus]
MQATAAFNPTCQPSQITAPSSTSSTSSNSSSSLSSSSCLKKSADADLLQAVAGEADKLSRHKEEELVCETAQQSGFDSSAQESSKLEAGGHASLDVDSNVRSAGTNGLPVRGGVNSDFRSSSKREKDQDGSGGKRSARWGSI